MKNVIENGNYCVYVHTSPSGKMYVGQTGTKPEYRWGKDGHGYLQKKNGEYTQPMFAYAIIKYGWDNFQHEIVASNLTLEEANNFEELLIEKLNTMDSHYGYNLREGGSNSKISEETKKKISETLKGNIISEEIKKKISNSLKGKRMGADSPYAKKVVQYNMRGGLIKIWDSVVDAERTLNLSQGNISKCCKDDSSYKTIGGYIWRWFGDELTQEHIDKCNRRKDKRYISQYSLSGELVCVFESIAEAERITGFSHSNIIKGCNGERKTVGGFIWRYSEEELTKEHLLWCNESLINKDSKKCVAQYSLSGEFICMFESIAEASSKTGINRSSISACCRGKSKTAGRFIWRYY